MELAYDLIADLTFVLLNPDLSFFQNTVFDCLIENTSLQLEWCMLAGWELGRSVVHKNIHHDEG